jgi:hypothetical protein
MRKMASHFVLDAEVEVAGNKNNGGNHEEHATSLPAHAEFASLQSPSALDWAEYPYHYATAQSHRSEVRWLRCKRTWMLCKRP